MLYMLHEKCVKNDDTTWKLLDGTYIFWLSQLLWIK